MIHSLHNYLCFIGCGMIIWQHSDMPKERRRCEHILVVVGLMQFTCHVNIFIHWLEFVSHLCWNHLTGFHHALCKWFSDGQMEPGEIHLSCGELDHGEGTEGSVLL